MSRNKRLNQFIQEHKHECYSMANQNNTLPPNDEWREDTEFNRWCDEEGERYCSVEESIVESCNEVKLMREGTKKKNSLQELWENIDEFKKEKEYGK